MGAGVAAALVEADAGDEAVLVGAELDAQLDRAVSGSTATAGVCVDVKIVHGQVAASAGSGGTATRKPKLRASPIRAASNVFLLRADLAAATDERIECFPRELVANSSSR